MIPFGSFAQIGDEFYLEAYNKADLTPINQTQNGKYIELEFSDPQLNSIFDNFQILNYEEAFDGLALCNAYDLDKVFILKLDSPVGINRLTVSPLIKKVEFPLKYELASEELTYKPNRITSLSPNPTTAQVEVEYKINEGESAYLAVTSVENPNISDNYILDMEESAFDLNVDNLSAGIYAVALIVNGQIADAKNLIKN